MVKIRVWFFPLFVVWLVAGSGRAAAATFSTPPTQEATPYTFESAPCMFEGLDLGITSVTPEDQGFECGYVTVPERHDNPEGTLIRLPVAIRPATSAVAQLDPLFLAQGGPGGSAFEIFSLLVPNTEIAAERDIVIFNQRGTQYAEPDLTCTEVHQARAELLAATGEEADALYSAALEACYQRLAAEGIDLSAYNSLENAADVEGIRRALGYGDYNFYGVSYGTLLGLHLMRDFPENLRAVILDSVVPTNINFVTESAQSENRVYDELFASCAAVPDCAAAYPDLEARYFALIERLEENPVTLTLYDPETGEAADAVLDGASLRGVMFQLFYVANFGAAFPKVVSELEAGNYTYLEQMWPLFAFDRSLSEGMYYSVICAEDADFQTADGLSDDLRPLIANDVEDELRLFLDTCQRWTVDELDAAVDEPVRSDIPTLLLSGRYDPITPPAFASAAAESLSNSYHVVYEQGSHGVAFQEPCINNIIQDFLDQPDVEPSTACLTTTGFEAFTPPDAIILPLLGKVNQLDSDLVSQFIYGVLLFLVVASVPVVWFLAFLVNALRKNPPVATAEEKRLRRMGYLLAIAFALLTAVFTIVLAAVIFTAILDPIYAISLAVPRSSLPLFFIPPLLVLIAVGMVVISVQQWRSGALSGIGRVYFSIVTLCAVGCLVLLGMQGLLLPPL